MSLSNTIEPEKKHSTGNVNIHGEEVPKIHFGVYLDVQLVILEQSYIFN